MHLKKAYLGCQNHFKNKLHCGKHMLKPDEQMYFFSFYASICSIFKEFLKVMKAGIFYVSIFPEDQLIHCLLSQQSLVIFILFRIFLFLAFLKFVLFLKLEETPFLIPLNRNRKKDEKLNFQDGDQGKYYFHAKILTRLFIIVVFLNYLCQLGSLFHQAKLNHIFQRFGC